MIETRKLSFIHPSLAGNLRSTTYHYPINHGPLTTCDSLLQIDAMKSIHSMSESSGGHSTTQPDHSMDPRTSELHPQHHAAIDPGASLSPTSHPAMISHHDDTSSRYHNRPVTPSSNSVHLLHYAAVTSPLRKDTASSVSTQATAATLGSSETNTTSYSADTSPSLHQSIFSIKDGTDVSNNRRASRRRTGPLSQQSRERAALIRKLGACPDCRRRRVAVSSSHLTEIRRNKLWLPNLLSAGSQFSLGRYTNRYS